MFLAVPNLFGIALKLLNLEAVPILPLDADDISFAPKAPLLDMGRLDGGRDISISSSKFNEIHKTFCRKVFTLFVLSSLTWKY